MREYDIYDLYGESWQIAIYDTIDKVNQNLGTKLFYDRDKHAVELLIHSLGIKFTKSGASVSDAKALETLYE